MFYFYAFFYEKLLTFNFFFSSDDRYRARIGSINQKIADEYGITQIAVPAGYTNGQFYDDIAILTLDREVNFPNFNPVCLPNEQVSRMNLNGRGTTVSGWGADRNGKLYAKNNAK